mmetsp:Transcript_31209/g.79125  ORF Transcript_31209/g.79125 Transcript_31209/m.79125 type:complete len:278 (+) Transcript_31209:3191-4024(+)
MSLKLGWYSTSLSPTLTKKLRPFLIFWRPTMGPMTASSASCRFSIMTEAPVSSAFSMVGSIFLLVRRVICRLFLLSFSLTHTMPWSCGSIMRGHLSAYVVMAPFSIETRSLGRPSLFHAAICAVSVRMRSGSGFSDMGMLFFLTKGSMQSSNSMPRNFLEKQPTYETKAEAMSTSPGSSVLSSFICCTLMAQRSCSDPRAFIRRCARASLFCSFSPSATTAFFSATTLSYSAMSVSSLLCRSATCALTSSSFWFASASSCCACLRALRLGSTVTTMS